MSTYFGGLASIYKSCKYTCTLTWAPAPIEWGVALTAAQLNAVNSCSTAVEYRIENGVLTLGALSPNDVGDYPAIVSAAETYTCNAAVGNATLQVTKRTPVIEWQVDGPNLSFPYGTLLTVEHHLKATAKYGGQVVPGNFVYRIVNGPVVNAGDKVDAGSKAVRATFTPNEPAKYETGVPATVTFDVKKVKPVLEWTLKKAGLAYGDQFTNEDQFTAKASYQSEQVEGTFVYKFEQNIGPVTVSNGFKPKCGKQGNGKLSVEFTPSNPTNYDAPDPLKPKNLTISKATPEVTVDDLASIPSGGWINDEDVVYTALYKGEKVEGAIAVTKQPNSIKPDTTVDCVLTFTPTDSEDYRTVPVTKSVGIVKGPFTITWDTPAAIDYGTPLGKVQLCAKGDTSPINFSYDPGHGDILKGGDHDIVVTATTTNRNYSNPKPLTRTIKIKRVMPSLVWTPAETNPSTALTDDQRNAKAQFSYKNYQGNTVVETVDGVFTYTPLVAGLTNAAPGQQVLSATFVPTDQDTFLTPPGAVTGTLTLKWATAQQLKDAGISQERVNKVLNGKVKENGDVIGGHSSNVALDNVNYRFTISNTRPNGVRDCQAGTFKKKKGDEFSNPKPNSHTFPPANWDDDAFLYAAIQTANAPESGTEAGAHYANVRRPGAPLTEATVRWKVTKKGGKVTAAYPV